MSSISNVFEQALLSEAAYANLVDSQGNALTNKADVEAALRGSANDRLFSAAQAADFVNTWGSK